MEEEEEDGDSSFCLSLLEEFAQQAAETHLKLKYEHQMLQNSLANIRNDLETPEKHARTISDLGHFMKGSAASVGLRALADCCLRIQLWHLPSDQLDASTEAFQKALKILNLLISEEYPRLTETGISCLRDLFRNQRVVQKQAVT